MSNSDDFVIPEEYKDLLNPIREKQIELASSISLENRISFGDISVIAGLDVAFSKKDDLACAGIVIIDSRSFEVLDEQVAFFEPRIPYIPTFLHYRESPGYQKLMTQISEKPDVLIFDGNGIIHPFGIGIASQMGLEFDTPSFGITKKLLLGQYDNRLNRGGFSDIISNEKTLGIAFQSLAPPAKPIFVSPGHLIDMRTIINILRDFNLQQKFSSKLPLPLALADKLVRAKI
ncbi:MAG: endonuclease V [Candidatus Heimdallarchaeota archaeon]